MMEMSGYQPWSLREEIGMKSRLEPAVSLRK